MTTISTDVTGEQPVEPPDTPTVPSTGRVQLALNVADLGEAVAFYSKLFDTPPAKERPGYANFAVDSPPLKLVLIEHPDGGTINHLGVEVTDTHAVSAAAQRLDATGLDTEEEAEVSCCYALQDKIWATAPDGERWEYYTVLADAPSMSSSDECCVPDTACC